MSRPEHESRGSAHFRRYRKGLRAATQNNGSAYAYSIYITLAFSMVQGQARPTLADLYLFLLGATVAFVLVEALVSKFFRVRLRGEDTGVMMLGSAMSGVAIAAAVGGSHAAAQFTSGWVRWFVSPLLGTLVFLAVVAVVMDVARRASERIPHESEQEPSPRQEEEQ